jgi:ABC-2 type transport system permease protein
MVSAFRYGFLGFSDVPLGLCFAVMGGFVVVFFGLTLFLFLRGAGLKK